MGDPVCRSCGAPIRWVRTHNDKLMPIDPDPVEGGNLELVNGRAFVVSGRQPNLLGEPRYVSHFVTCPDADEHRR